MKKESLDALIDGLNALRNNESEIEIGSVNYGGDEGYWSYESESIEEFSEQLDELIEQLVDNVPINGEYYTTGNIYYDFESMRLHFNGQEENLEDLITESFKLNISDEFKSKFVSKIVPAFGDDSNIIYSNDESAGHEDFSQFYPMLEDGEYEYNDIIELRKMLAKLLKENIQDIDDVQRVSIRLDKDNDIHLFLEVATSTTCKVSEEIYLDEYEYED